LAHRLKTKQPDLRLAIVGPSARPGAATLAAGAMLNAWAELVRDQFEYPTLAARGRIRSDALALWDGFAAELSAFAPQPLNVRWGALVIDTGRGGGYERQSIDTMTAELARIGSPTFVEPSHGDFPRSILIPDGWIAPAPVLAALEAALRANGADLIDANVERVEKTGDWRATLSDGRILEAGTVVLANGFFAQALVDQLPDVAESTPRIVTEIGTGWDFTSEAPALPVDVVRSMARGAAPGFHLISLGEQRYYLGSTARVARDIDWTAPEEKLAGLRRTLAEELGPAWGKGRFTARKVGFRALPMDGFPLLGESHDKGLWFATGMHRDGFTSMPLIANGLAGAMLDSVPNPFARFTPSRGLLSYKTRDAAFADAIAVHGEDKREAFTRVYDKQKAGEDFGIFPGLMPLFAS
jgi:glycine/D-amino acid oxidase-like deaminating enzyme